MVDWLRLTAEWLQPIYQLIRTAVLAGDYRQVDETPLRYLDPGGGRCGTGYLWTVNRPGYGVYYQWHDSRAAHCLTQVLGADCAGILQCDGYAGYPSHNQQRAKPLLLAGCWAHSRRKFFAAQQAGEKDATLILYLIGHLYRAERHCRAWSPHRRQAMRERQSRPVLTHLHQVLTLWQRRHRHLPQSLMGKAIDYTLKQWPQLMVYIDHGQVELDNNAVENAIRPTAVGKKNWLFIGHANAGQVSAILYTVVENCRRLNLNPETYLREVLTRLPAATNHTVHTLTPQAWAAEQEQPLPLAA